MGTLYERALEPTTALTFAAALALAVYVFRPGQKKYNLPPYPWTRLPGIGNMFSLMLSKDKAFVNFYKMSMTAEYEKVFMIQIGGRDICILNHIDVVKEALRDKPVDFAGRPNLFTVELLNMSKSLSMTNYSREWKFQKKVAHLAIRKFASGAILEEKVHDAARYAIAEIERHGQEPFVIKSYLEYLVFNLMAGVLFGKTYDYKDEKFQQFRDMSRKGLEAMGSGVPADLFPWMRIIPFQGRGLKDLVKPFTDLISTQLQEHKKRFDPDSLHDLLDYMLLTQKEAEEAESEMGDVMDDERIAMTIFDMYGASIDTLNQALQCLVARAALNPDIQDKLYEEVDSVLGNRLPVSSDRHNLPYIEAFISEVMRIDTMAPLGLPLSTTCDTTIGNYELPKNTMVMINFWAVNHNPEYWQDPDVFNPSRFLDESGQLGPRPESFMPFSGGKRVCVGETLAKSGLIIIVAMLIQKMKFVAPENFSFDFESGAGSGLANLPKIYEIIVQARE